MSENVRSIVTRAPSAPLDFNEQQLKMIRDSFLNGASPADAAVLLELARVRRLNPITRQIHFVKRWDGIKKVEVWSAQVGIDGFRAIAERTGLYDGQDEPEFEYEGEGKTKQLKLCRVKVYRKDWSRGVVGVAHFSEYAQYKFDGKLTHMWATKPHIMIAKCAEALAFRKAFPDDTSGLYVPEEMSEQPERELNAPPQSTPAAEKSTRTDAIKAKLAAKTQAANIEAPTAAPEQVPVAGVVVERKVPEVSAMSTQELDTNIKELRAWIEKNPRSTRIAKGRERLTDLELELADRQAALAQEQASVEEEAPFP